MRRQSLLSSDARIQVPWVKVTIGDYSFGVYSKNKGTAQVKDKGKNAIVYNNVSIQRYPNYIQKLTIVKINGQVNKYTLDITYPVTQEDDPNFFEKVFSSISNTRKIMFSYGDAFMPSYVYKDEEALVTGITQSFNLESSTITYSVQAVSSAALGNSTIITRVATGKPEKPSDIIKQLWRDQEMGLKDLFTGMSESNLNSLIDGTDQPVILQTKTNISVLDYIRYLVSCMIPVGTAANSDIAPDIYILTLHDETIKDTINGKPSLITGPYFKVTRTSYQVDQSDAYEIDIGYNTRTLVTSFSIENNENYSILYDYQKEIHPKQYVRRINEDGIWEDVFAPATTTGGDDYMTDEDDVTWWTKLTKYPIKATITVQGLLRPAELMTHLRLNVIFPGGHKHISSGLYIITKQIDTIDANGYRTQLGLTRIGS